MEINKIYCMDCVDGMEMLPSNSVDLTVTSPPYDKIRNYNGYTFDFKNTAKQLLRVTKDGGVVVWVVGDETTDGDESGTSFKQALYFKEIGFNLHDTMIWNKGGFSAVGALRVRYAPVFEYMFIFTKGRIKTFNPLKDRKTINGGKKASGTIRQRDGSTKPMSKVMTINKFGQRYNIWEISPQRQRGKVHPAPFPEQIANDHILSWSNVGDLILDPFMGSGTTAKMSLLNDRNFIGFELSQEYCDIANSRLEDVSEEEEIVDEHEFED